MEDSTTDDVFSSAAGPSAGPSVEVPTLAETAKELKKLSNEFHDFKTVCTKKSLQDTYQFAEISEADDWKYNLENANRVMVNGVYYHR